MLLYDSGGNRGWENVPRYDNDVLQAWLLRLKLEKYDNEYATKIRYHDQLKRHFSYVHIIHVVVQNTIETTLIDWINIIMIPWENLSAVMMSQQ